MKHKVIALDEAVLKPRILFTTQKVLLKTHLPSNRKYVVLIGITIKLLKKSSTARLKEVYQYF